MKFKAIFLIFNIISIFSLLFISFLSFFIFGFEYSISFWKIYWYYPIAFFFVILILDIYFCKNWHFFHLLESENWNNVLKYIEEMIFNRKKIKKKYIKIIINLYIIHSELDKMVELEDFLRKNKPEYLLLFPLQLGIPYLLKNNPVKMEEYYGNFIDKKKCKDRLWILWNYSFSLILQKKSKKAKEALLKIIKYSKEPVLIMLSYYFLYTFANSEIKMSKLIADGMRKLKNRFTRDLWNREIEKSKSNIQVVIISKLIKEASEWMFSYNI